MTPEYLKELLPSLLNADFAGATNVRLLSLARTYAALCCLLYTSGNYVYFYEGNAVETGADSFESKAYVTVFNYSGKIVVPRTEVAAVADKAGLAAAGLTTTGYACLLYTSRCV